MVLSSLALALGARGLATTLAVSQVIGASGWAAAYAPEGTTPETSTKPEDNERLSQLYASARTLYDEGQYDAAATAFRAAYEISPEPNLLYNIYICYDRLGRLDEALEYLNRYADDAPAGEQAELERRRASVQARLDRKVRNAEAADEQAATTEPEPSDSAAAVTKKSRDDGEPEPPRVFGPAAWVLTGVAVAAAGIGAGLGGASLSRRNSAQNACPDTPDGRLCNEDAEGDIDSARRLGIGADVSFGIAGASAIALVIVIAVNASKRRKARSPDAARRAAPTLTPTLGARRAGLSFTTRF